MPQKEHRSLVQFCSPASLSDLLHVPAMCAPTRCPTAYHHTSGARRVVRARRQTFPDTAETSRRAS
ncbi:hypothetical protein C8R44DRAFT_761823 [Mycena epipterygia]|nr:hypothetical protein C8R44DRAFT_761823 [Mycena epipterygia]